MQPLFWGGVLAILGILTWQGLCNRFSPPRSVQFKRFTGEVVTAQIILLSLHGDGLCLAWFRHHACRSPLVHMRALSKRHTKIVTFSMPFEFRNSVLSVCFAEMVLGMIW